jgi:4'-phosphopantetheinyl transferase
MDRLMAQADRIDLWLARCADVSDELLTRYRELLPTRERREEQRFYLVLSRYGDIAPGAWRFRRNRYGRPEVASSGDATRALGFNVSHTTELILLGVTLDGPIGVDIEMVRSVLPMELAGRFFAADEAAALAALPADRQCERFFEYWTLKESYTKAMGMGLALPLDSFSFDLSVAGHIRFSSLTARGGRAAQWEFWQLRPANDHLAAVCVRHATACPRRVSLRKIVPLCTETLFECPPCRRSDEL